MTLAIDRPTATLIPRYASGTFPCPKGVEWCNDEAAASDENHLTCWSGELYLPVTGSLRPDGTLGGGAGFVSILLERTRDEEPTIALNVGYSVGDPGEADAAVLTLDEAERFGRYLIDQAARLRGEVR